MRFNFSLRLMLFSTVLVCISVGISSLLSYQRAKQDLEESLAAELLAVARSAAALIDSDLVELVYLDEEGSVAFEDEFDLLRAQLDRVRLMNDLPRDGNPIYVMRPTAGYEARGELEFVAMPDRDENGRFFVGNVYPAEEHNKRALAGHASTSGVYSDGEGVWLSASAPLFNSAGRLVGLLQVDRPVDHLYEQARSRALAIAWGSLFSIGAGILLAMLFARQLVEPLEIIARAARALGRGDLDQRVSVRRNDEIGDLAEGFNQMAEQLKLDTERLEYAREKAEVTSRALVTSGRLAAVGQLAAGVAHEINNPLTYVRANLSMLRSHWSDLGKQLDTSEPRGSSDAILGEGEELIEESIEGVDRAVAIVRDIKGFAHSGTDHHELTDLNALLDSVVRVASAQLASGIEIEREFEDVPQVPCSQQELKQVFLNLVINAGQAIDKAGKIRLSTCQRGEFVVATIADDGRGIEPEILDRLFDPFFTTKPVGKGTGLGLSISYDIIHRHGGEIEVVSTPGKGAAFSVHLPLNG